MLLFSPAVQCTAVLALLAGWCSPFTQPKPQNNLSFSYNFICHSSFTDTVKDTLTDTVSSVSSTVLPMIPCVLMLKINELQHFRINAGLSSAINFSRLSRPIDCTSHAFCLPFLHSSRPEDNRRGLASFFWHLKDRKVSCLCGWYCCQMELHTNLALLLRNALSPKWKKVSQQPGKESFLKGKDALSASTVWDHDS